MGSNRLRLHHGNAIRIGDTIYFSSGGKGSQAILSAVDVRSGTVHWQERSIEKATFVWADQKLVTLDQGRQPDDRVSLAARLPHCGEGVDDDASLLDAARARRHAPVCATDRR